MYQKEKEWTFGQGWAFIGGCAILLALAIGCIFGAIHYSNVYYNQEKEPIQNSEHVHSWTTQNVDGENVTLCESCGKINQSTEHLHSWEAQKIDNEIVVICKDCGKLAEK